MSEQNTPNIRVDSDDKRNADLERELVAEAVAALRDWWRLNRLMITTVKTKEQPLGARDSAATTLIKAVQSLISFYGEHGYRGQTKLDRDAVLTRLEFIAALPPMPPKTTMADWRTFFALVAAVQSAADYGIYEHTGQLVSQFSNTTANWWLQRAIAYNTCMQQHGVLEKTRV